MREAIQKKLVCYHCGDICQADSVESGEKVFCCEGCRLVYDILQENNLCSYYDLNEKPGNKSGALTEGRFDFLDREEISNKLITFKNKNEVHISFHIPEIHCSSCIWLLENFRRVDKGVLQAKVNFLKKEIQLVFDDSQTSLRKIAEELTRIGYEPSIHLDSL